MVAVKLGQMYVQRALNVDLCLMEDAKLGHMYVQAVVTGDSSGHWRGSRADW